MVEVPANIENETVSLADTVVSLDTLWGWGWVFLATQKFWPIFHFSGEGGGYSKLKVPSSDQFFIFLG